MFGDIMHGALLLAFALWICFSVKPGGVLHQLRHFLLLMGIFSTFCGFCYNDYTSVPLYLFGESCWIYTEGTSEAIAKPDCVYPVGVDPGWFLST